MRMAWTGFGGRGLIGGWGLTVKGRGLAGKGQLNANLSPCAPQRLTGNVFV